MDKLSKVQFYILSFTWGLLVNTAGSFVALIMLITGHRPKHHGWCVYFEIGKKAWGGMEWGIFFITDKTGSTHVKNHEFGHAIQNCFFGPFMIFISLQSTIRYWYRRISSKFGKKHKNGYDHIWFEGQATRLGTEYIRRINGVTDTSGI